MRIRHDTYATIFDTVYVATHGQPAADRRLPAAGRGRCWLTDPTRSWPLLALVAPLLRARRCAASSPCSPRSPRGVARRCVTHLRPDLAGVLAAGDGAGRAQLRRPGRARRRHPGRLGTCRPGPLAIPVLVVLMRPHRLDRAARPGRAGRATRRPGCAIVLRAALVPGGAPLVPHRAVAGRARPAGATPRRPARRSRSGWPRPRCSTSSGPTAGSPCDPRSTPSRRPSSDPLRTRGHLHDPAQLRETRSMTAIDVRPDAEATAAAVAAALRTIDANIAAFGDRYPGDTTVHNRYRLRPPTAASPPDPTWAGRPASGRACSGSPIDLTGDEAYLRAAMSHVDSFAERVRRGIDLDTHDLGFLYTLACVAGVAADRRRAGPTRRAGRRRAPARPGPAARRHHPGLGRPARPAPARPHHHRQPHEHAAAVLGQRDHRRSALRRAPPAGTPSSCVTTSCAPTAPRSTRSTGIRGPASRCAARPSRAAPTTHAGHGGRRGASTGSA